MRRLAVILVVFALVVEYIITGAMGMRVSQLERELEATRAQQAAAQAAFPLTLGARSPSVTFKDQRSLANYIVKVHDDLHTLQGALERDIHAQQAAGGRELSNTHAALDKKPRLAHAHDAAAEPYLGYTDK